MADEREADEDSLGEAADQSTPLTDHIRPLVGSGDRRISLSEDDVRLGNSGEHGEQVVPRAQKP